MMMNKVKHQLTMDRPVTYEIKVPGKLDESWAEWTDWMTIICDPTRAGPPITTLTGTLDQGVLHGLLRRLYSQGLPLISVIWVSG